jgi:mannosyltransferase
MSDPGVSGLPDAPEPAAGQHDDVPLPESRLPVPPVAGVRPSEPARRDAGGVEPRSVRVFHAIAPWALGAAAVVLGAFSAGAPSFWRDEVATISAARRTLPQLFEMLRHYDAVHGLYYTVMHAWIGWFGQAEAVVRFPSALAVGLAVVVTAWLGRMLLGRWWGLLAGVLLICVPRVMWAAVEARSTAFTLLFVTLAAAALTAALRHRRWWWWVVTGLAIFASAATSVLAIPALAALPIALAVQRVPRRTWAAFAASSLAPAAAYMPIGLTAVRQSGQVAWIPPLTVKSAVGMLRDVFLWQDVPGAAYALWVVLVAAVVIAIVGVVRRRLAGIVWRPAAAFALVTASLVLPILFVCLAAPFGQRLYYPRYFTFLASAFVLLLTMALATLRSRIVALAVLVAMLVAAVDPYLQYRSAGAKADLRTVAQWIGSRARAGDGLLFGNENAISGSSRIVSIAYPTEVSGLVDLRLGESAADAGRIFPTDRPFTASMLADVREVFWVVAPGTGNSVPGFTATLTEAGLHRTDSMNAGGGWSVLVYAR